MKEAEKAENGWSEAATTQASEVHLQGLQETAEHCQSSPCFHDQTARCLSFPPRTLGGSLHKLGSEKGTDLSSSVTQTHSWVCL